MEPEFSLFPHRNCIRLQVSFDFYGHTCLVTELLSASVFDFLKENAYEPFPLSHVQQFGKQLLLALQCKSSLSIPLTFHLSDDLLTPITVVHKNNLVHTDLKPENILLLDNRSTVVPSRVSLDLPLLSRDLLLPENVRSNLHRNRNRRPGNSSTKQTFV